MVTVRHQLPQEEGLHRAGQGTGHVADAQKTRVVAYSGVSTPNTPPTPLPHPASEMFKFPIKIIPQPSRNHSGVDDFGEKTLTTACRSNS